MAPFHCPPTCEHAGTSSFPSRPPRPTATWQLSSPRAVRRNSFHHQGGSTSLQLQKQRGSHASASQMPKAALSPRRPWRPGICLALKLCGACQRWGAPGTEAKDSGQPPWGEGRGLRPSFLLAAQPCPGPRQDRASLLLSPRGRPGLRKALGAGLSTGGGTGGTALSPARCRPGRRQRRPSRRSSCPGLWLQHRQTPILGKTCRCGAHPGQLPSSPPSFPPSPPSLSRPRPRERTEGRQSSANTLRC